MEDFKSSPKMQCFKEGGSVKYKSRHSEKSEMSEDIAKDTKMIKKGVKQHESALHKGEPKTELKLKKGGRMKKEGGCVGRYKKGGEVKKCAEGGSLKPVDTEENPGLAKLPTNVRNKMGYAKKGGGVKKMNVGGRSDIEEVKENLYMRPGENTTYSKVRGIGPAIAASRLKERGVDIPGLIANRARNSSEDPYKKGGLAKKYNEGGRALYDEALQTRSKTGKAGVEAAKESTLGKPSTPEQKEMAKKESIKLGTLDFPHSRKTSREFSEMKKGGKVKKYADGGMVTDEEKARMPAGKLPQQVVDEEATAANTETREMVAGPLRKLKKGVMETFKSKTKTPMKHGGKAC